MQDFVLAGVGSEIFIQFGDVQLTCRTGQEDKFQPFPFELRLDKCVILVHIPDERKPHPVIPVSGSEKYHLVLGGHEGNPVGTETQIFYLHGVLFYPNSASKNTYILALYITKGQKLCPKINILFQKSTDSFAKE